ncbi:hypothetical protein B0H65DRAFT_589774 [Neurospora tetraspora]|uniref:Uncharacterized protein n=1 Tax=Neurospora tetraspora TaxID=94610 RepID=A0AAE0JCR4_9PEZI|nr:hypothetical protein B0H65DRAFT_589774 [Neurospora tetraspora]
MPSPSDIPPGNNAFNNTNNMVNISRANDAPTPTRIPTPAPWFFLSRRRHLPSPSLSNQEQDEVFNRISSSMSHSSTLAARQEPNVAAGLPTSPGLHILRRARIVEYIKSYTSARERHDGQQREATTEWGVVGVPVLETHPHSPSFFITALYHDGHDGEITPPPASPHGAFLSDIIRTSSPDSPDNKSDTSAGGRRRSQSASRDVVEHFVSGSDAGEDEDEDEDELLFLQTPPNPNPNYSSSSRVGTTTITGSITDMLLGTMTAEEQAVVSRTWKKVLKSKGRGVTTTTQHGDMDAVAEEGEGNNSEGGAVLWNKVAMQEEEEDSDSDGGGAPLSGSSSENGSSRLGNDRRREKGGSDGRRLDGGSNRRIDLAQFAARHHHQQFWHGPGLRANSDRQKADAAAQLERHRRPSDTPILPAFRSGIETGACRSDAGADITLELFSTLFRLQRAEARARQRVLNRFSSLDHPGRINSLQDGGQQARQPGRSQQRNPDDASTSNADHFTSERHRFHHFTEPPLTSNTTRSLHLPPPTPSRPSKGSSSRSVLAQSSTPPPRAPLPHEPQGSRTTNQVPKPPSPTTTTTGDFTPTTGNSTTTPLSSSSSSKLGPFPLSPSTVALLASSQASFERLTTPKFHPAGVSRSRQNQEAQIQAHTAAWTNIDIGKGKEEEEGEKEGEEGWEMVDNPCDEYRVIYNPGKGNGYARNGGFGRREVEVEGEVDELPGGLEETCTDYGFVLDRKGDGEGSTSAGGGPQQQQHQHHQIPIVVPPLHRDITRHGTPSTTSTTSQTQTQPHLATSRLRQLQQTERESTVSTSLSVSSYAPLSRPSMSSSSPYPSPFSGEVGVRVGAGGRGQNEEQKGKGKAKGKEKWKGTANEQERHGNGRREVETRTTRVQQNSLHLGRNNGQRDYRGQGQGQGSNFPSSTNRNEERESERRRGDTRVNIRMGRIVQPSGSRAHTGGSVAQPSGRPGLDDDSVDIDEGFADVLPGRVGKKQ